MRALRDVPKDCCRPDAVKAHTLAAGVRVVIGTSGLTAADYAEIDQAAKERNLGVIAAGNFSLTAPLAKHFSPLAAQYLSSWELVHHARPPKIDAPSGAVRELAQELGRGAPPHPAGPVGRD